MKTLLVPTDGVWRYAPEQMPKEGDWCLILVNHTPQVGFCNPTQYAGWAIVICNGKRNYSHKVIAGLEEEIFWAPLTQLDELRFQVND
ncbi:MAG: hypothetical protein AAF810_01455 [Cyanobacteria bacterium P01_D01_bin.36]